MLFSSLLICGYDMSISNVAMTILFNHPGVVTSPNYPDKYPNDLRNTTTIKVVKGMIVALKFTAFNVEIESWDDSCPYDHLTIKDGDGSTLMEKTCGQSLPENLVSKSNVVKLYFTTDDSVAESVVTSLDISGIDT